MNRLKFLFFAIVSLTLIAGILSSIFLFKKNDTMTVTPHSQPASSLTQKQLKETFGEQVRADFDQKGHLISLSKGTDLTQSNDRTFSPHDAKSVLSQAHKLLSSATSLINIRQDSPLGTPTVHTGQYSAQVFYKQLYKTFPVYPHGNITLDIGPKGELLNLSSDYVHGITTTNHIKLTRQDAQNAISQQFPEELSEGGRIIVWIPTPTNPNGQFAYEFLVKGKKILIDAETGKILSRKDQRQFHSPRSK